MTAARTRWVLPDTVLLVFICTLDTLYTLYAVRAGLAKETNPLLQGSLAHSDVAFLLVKGATFLIPVGFLESLRSYNPDLIARAMRICLFGYVAIYVIGSLGTQLPK